LDTIFATRTRDEWAAIFDADPDFFWAPVNDVDDVLADPQTHAAGVVVEVAADDGPVRVVDSPIDFVGTPPAPYRGAPALGEHTDEVLVELGLRAEVGGGRT
jgi:crotonobetainyl-CoA:carnitine CoA-transferase CaiB-like acyl-CoA transferase